MEFVKPKGASQSASGLIGLPLFSYTSCTLGITVRYLQKFTVEGHGTFPFDMLRYDYCFPNCEENNLEVERVKGTWGVRRQVKLARYCENKKSMPTQARWHSFGWTVLPESIETHRLRA
jgi:hypothetical protein